MQACDKGKSYFLKVRSKGKFWQMFILCLLHVMDTIGTGNNLEKCLFESNIDIN